MRYEAEYAAANADWHVEDAPDKVRDVLLSITAAALRPSSICDIGCGAGAVLEALTKRLRVERAVGYDISEYAIRIARERERAPLRFIAANATDDPEEFELMLLLDVVEHVGDPVAFLRALRRKAPAAIVNLPLELSVSSALRPASLVRARQRLGHVHYFNEEIAYEMVFEAGYRVRDARISPPGLGHRGRNYRTQTARAVRRSAVRVAPHLAARIIGGSSLMMVLEVAG